MRLPGVVRTAQGEITLCNYSRKYLGLKKKKNRHGCVTAIKEEKQARRPSGKERGRVIILCTAAAAAVKMLGRDAMRQSKEAAPMHPANLVTWKIKQGGTLSL